MDLAIASCWRKSKVLPNEFRASRPKHRHAGACCARQTMMMATSEVPLASLEAGQIERIRKALARLPCLSQGTAETVQARSWNRWQRSTHSGQTVLGVAVKHPRGGGIHHDVSVATV